MTRDEAKKLIPVIQAYADGKDVQCKFNDMPCMPKNEWNDINEPLWHSDREYRIKPEPLECWVVIDKDGDDYMYRKESDARIHANGYFAPYTIHHMREVI